jgi:antirestriction protein ArdC
MSNYREQKKASDKAKVNAAMSNIVGAVIEAMKNGTAPWQRPWHTRGNPPTNLSTGKVYQGGNYFFLSVMGGAFGCDHWIGFQQAKKLGGKMIGSQKGTPILRPLRFKREDSNGDTQYYTGGFKLAYVWNVTQWSGLTLPDVETRSEQDIDPRALDIFAANTGADITHDGGDRAYYQPATDSVHMPEKSEFKTEGGYYGTLLHELTHWTGHKSRLDRSKAKSEAKHGYAFEELVAELGAYHLSERIGCPNECENHASYMQSWLKALDNDPAYLWKAASLAEKAADLLETLGRGEAKAA